jgi:sugar phosphate isomerase/epimerase
MGKVYIGVNMEFVRSADKPFAWGVAKAAEIGYEYIEPMVHWGRELLSEARYFHSVSMYDDPRWARDLCDTHKIKMSGLSSHTPLCKPEISVEYLKLAIRWASDAGAPVVNTDEGPKPEWTTREQDYTLMTYTLKEASMVAERYDVKIGVEPHQQYSKSQAGLDSIYNLV